MRSLFSLLLLVLFRPVSVSAQLQLRPYEFGLGVGSIIYQGDLTPEYTGAYHSLRPAIRLDLGRRLGSHLSVGAGLLLGTVAADESVYESPSWRKQRNFRFRTKMAELSASLQWNFFATDDTRRVALNPFVFAGLGTSFLRVRKDWSRVNVEAYDASSVVQRGLAIDSLAASSRLIGVLPVGIGVRYQLTMQLALTASASYRLSATDYIDGFKYSGNAAKDDHYYGVSIGISYRLGGYRCPPVK